MRKDEYDDEYYVELIDKIKAGATIKYPPQVVEHEAEHVLEDLSQPPRTARAGTGNLLQDAADHAGEVHGRGSQTGRNQAPGTLTHP